MYSLNDQHERTIARNSATYLWMYTEFCFHFPW